VEGRQRPVRSIKFYNSVRAVQSIDEAVVVMPCLLPADIPHELLDAAPVSRSKKG
jgi:hypothetical protein